jgi:hypothetical protein
MRFRSAALTCALCVGVAAKAESPTERKVEVLSTSPSAFTTERGPYSGRYASATGFVSLEATDRVSAEDVSDGDVAVFSARVKAQGHTYRVQLSRPGWSLDREPRTPGPPNMAGGVRVETRLHSGTGRGYGQWPAMNAAVWLWGRGTVMRDEAVVGDNIPIEVYALTQGVHADDKTHRVSTKGRRGDFELHVLVPQLTLPNGPTFLQFVFEDVEIIQDGRALGDSRIAKKLRRRGGAESGSPRTRGTSLAQGGDETPSKTGTGGSGPAGRGPNEGPDGAAKEKSPSPGHSPSPDARVPPRS